MLSFHIDQANAQLPTILITDDESDDLYILQHRLAKAGIANPIAAFRDGEQLIKFLQKRASTDPDRLCVLLLDLKMPMVDGFDVLQWLRGQAHLKNLPVAVISSSARPEDRDRALQSGACEYFEKFPTDADLAAVVARASEHPFSKE